MWLLYMNVGKQSRQFFKPIAYKQKQEGRWVAGEEEERRR